MKSENYAVALVVLAGGKSARYKGNKLLSEHPTSGLPLIQHSVGEVVSVRNNVALTSELPITVVTGKWHNSVSTQLKHSSCEVFDLPISIVRNANWDEGLASSIRTGLTHILSLSSLPTSVTPTADGLFKNPTHVLFTLADLPSLNAQDFVRLINTANANPSHIVCSEWYKEGETKSRLTVPAIFPEAMFSELLALEGDTGAKPIIKKYKKLGRVTTVSIPNAQFDIDTPQDWATLERRG